MSQGRKEKGAHRVNLPLTLSVPPATQEKAGGRKAGGFRCALNLAAPGEKHGRNPADTPPSRDVGAFQDGPTAPAS